MSEIIVANDHLWLQYFDRRAAWESVVAHVAGLPSSRTDEKHTYRVYASGVKYFFEWIGDELPTPDQVRAFIAHLVQRGLKSSTISSKYLAPLRHYLNRLADQLRPGLKGDERDFVSDCRDYIRQAAALPSPKAETTTNIAPLWGQGKRLDFKQVNAVLRHIDTTSIAGLRDYALLHIGFSTGLRLAELGRITLDSIKPTGDGLYLITVRGKRSNIDPVPVGAQAFADMMNYVNAYNEALPADDPRRITGDTPIWQPLHRDRFHFAIGRHNPCKGMSHQAIRDMIAKRTSAALGQAWALAPHDLRRSAAAIAYEDGMNVTDIQSLLRHKDAAVTMVYIGKRPDYASRALCTRMKFG